MSYVWNFLKGKEWSGSRVLGDVFYSSDTHKCKNGVCVCVCGRLCIYVCVVICDSS